MLTIDLDVTDMLSNGSLGTLRGVLRDKSTGEPVILMVQFDMDDSRKKLQGRHPNLVKSFPGCTPILNKLTSIPQPNTQREQELSLPLFASIRLFPVRESLGTRSKAKL